MTLRPALILPLAALAALAACSDPLKTERFQIAPPPAARSLPDRIGSAVLRDVSLPQYASDQEIAFQTEDGAVRSDPKKLWADNPQRAITLALASQISDVSGAQVIAEPWPLSEPASRAIEVRVERLLATAQGTMRMTGRYYVSAQSGTGADIVRSFDIEVPVAASGQGAIAAAESAAVAALAKQIAALR